MPTVLSLIDQVQNTRVWFFIKGIFLLFMAALAFFGVFEIYILMMIFAIFAIAMGIVTIVMSFVNPIDDRAYAGFGFTVGIINLLIGVTYLIWPYFFTEVWLIVFVIGMMLDGLFTASALLSVKAMGASKWWSILGGLVVLFAGVVIIYRILSYPIVSGQIVTTIYSFAIYLLTAAAFYLVTVAVIKPENIVTSVERKMEKKMVKSVKKSTKARRK